MSHNVSEKKEHLYMEVYHRYQELILSGQLKSGTKMPSLRKATEEWKHSRTTIETAYLQLAADGYLIARPQSGYYVTDIAEARKKQALLPHEQRPELAPLYDFASTGVDRESFRFDLWQRYIRSALRQDERLLTYGEPQGEPDFRQVLADFVRQRRNILCSPDNIVVGAGVQNLLQILCPLIRNRHTVSFPTSAFVQGSTIFQDYGFDVHYRDKDSDVIYVSPAHMTSWGEIMTVRRRMELLRYASEHNSLIIEDDYENEFVYLQKPTPSLYGLSAKQNVIYLGSFSRLLLPSIRISFMILPDALLKTYSLRAAQYNQTASKAEQIALCQFLRDGHLGAQTRRLKRLYDRKERKLIEQLQNVFGDRIAIRRGEAGTRLAVSFDTLLTESEVLKRAAEHRIRLRVIPAPGDVPFQSSVTLLLSCSSMPVEEYEAALNVLKKVLEGDTSPTGTGTSTPKSI